MTVTINVSSPALNLSVCAKDNFTSAIPAPVKLISEPEIVNVFAGFSETNETVKFPSELHENPELPSAKRAVILTLGSLNTFVRFVTVIVGSALFTVIVNVVEPAK